RSDHWIFNRAAADVLDLGFSGLADGTRFLRSNRLPPHLPRPRSRRLVHIVRHRIFATGRCAVWHRPARRVRRTHLPAGTRTATLPDSSHSRVGTGAGREHAGNSVCASPHNATRLMASAVVFAYHNVGVRCLSVLLAHEVDVRLVVTHDNAPGENIW